MKTTHILFFIAILVSSTSCTRILMFLKGAHSPRPENESTVRGFSEKMEWPQDNIFIFADSSGFYNYHRNIGTYPWISFYNKDMYLLNVREKGECAGVIDSVIHNLALGNIYPVDSTSRLPSLIPMLCDLDGEPLQISDLKQSDFYVVLYWAIFIGKLNKNNVKVWEEQLNEKAQTMGITVLKVNCDIMESWLEE